MTYRRHNEERPKRHTMREGAIAVLRGYVTTLVSVIGRTPAELESRLGFSPGRFSAGWALYFLMEGVGPNEFRWRGRTCHSAGWVWDADAGDHVQHADLVRWSKFVSSASHAARADASGWVWDADASVYAQHTDLQRWSMSTKSESHAARADAQFDLLMVDQHRRINARTGSERIVKAVPIQDGGGYPDAPGHGAPQWELMTHKRFRCAAVLAPGARYQGGAAEPALYADPS